MPQRNLDNYFVGSKDANILKDSQEKIIISDTCDSIITLPNNHQEDFAEPAVPADELFNAAKRVRFYVGPDETIMDLRTNVTLENNEETLLRVLEALQLSKNRGISAMNWSDRCSLKWRLYNSEHPHGDCRFSESLRLLFITGVQPRKLRIKDWQNAHGKVAYGAVAIHGFLPHLPSKETTKTRERGNDYMQHCPGLD